MEIKVEKFSWDVSQLPKDVYTVYAYVNDDYALAEYDYANNVASTDLDLGEINVIEISLIEGWKLISLKREPYNTATSAVLNSIEGE